MKKTLVTLLALVFVLGIAGTALAAPANPFVDVPAKHWAYGAISQLAKAGIVDGYGDGTFRGDKAMTRYEMAQVVAKAMAKSEKADAEQKALIDKLAVEFAAELNNLGVRVAKLEANQPNIKFAGDLRVRYTAADYTATPKTSNVSGQYRLRLDGTAKVDDNSTAGFRFVSREPDKAGFTNGNTWQTFGGAAQDAGYGAVDRVFWTTKLGDLGLTAGRQSLIVDSQNVFMDQGAFSQDGIKLTTKVGDLGFTAQWGRFVKGVTYNGTGVATTDYVGVNAALGNLDVASLAMSSKIGKFDWTLGFYNFNNPVADQAAFKWTLFDTKYTFDNKWALQAEYLHNGAQEMVASHGNNAYVLKLTMGDFALKKAGDQNFQVQYVNTKANAFYNGFSGLDAHTGNKDVNVVDYKLYWFGYNYAFSKSFFTTVAYSLVKGENKLDSNDQKQFRVTTNVVF